MKLIGYTVDLSFTNTPRVDARVAIPDPVTGEEKTETLHFIDDDGREMVAMVPNPNGEGLVNHPDGLVDGAKLRAKAEARVAEMRGGTAATSLAARVAAAEEARRTAHAAQIAAQAAEDAKTKAEEARISEERIASEARNAAVAAEEARRQASAEMAAALAAVEEAKATKAKLDAEIVAAEKAKAEAAKPADPSPR